MSREGIILEPQNEAEASIAELEAIKGELHAWGHNDQEIPRLNELIQGVKAKRLSPKDALNEAHAMQASKQDYH